jgi:hypothetical protein
MEKKICYVCNITLKDNQYQPVPTKDKMLYRHISKCYPGTDSWKKAKKEKKI